MLKQNKKDKQQDGHRWLLIGFLCLFGVCLVAQVRPTGQKPTAGASTKSTADTSKTAPKTKTPAGNKKQSVRRTVIGSTFSTIILTPLLFYVKHLILLSVKNLLFHFHFSRFYCLYP